MLFQTLVKSIFNRPSHTLLFFIKTNFNLFFYRLFFFCFFFFSLLSCRQESTHTLSNGKEIICLEPMFNTHNIKNLIEQNTNKEIAISVSSNSKSLHKNLITGVYNIIHEIKKRYTINTVEAVVSLKCYLQNSTNIVGANLIGVEPTSQIFDLKKYNFSFNNMTNSEPIVLNSETAKALNVSVGGALQAYSILGDKVNFSVIGIFEKNQDVPNNNFISLQAARMFEGFMETEATNLVILNPENSKNLSNSDSFIKENNLQLSRTNFLQTEAITPILSELDTIPNNESKETNSEFVITNLSAKKKEYLLIDEEEFGPVTLSVRQSKSKIGHIRNAMGLAKMVESRLGNIVAYSFPYFNVVSLCKIGKPEINNNAEQYPETEVFIRLRGVLPEKEIVLNNLNSQLANSSLERFKSLSNGILLGEELAQKLGLKRESKLNLISTTGEIFHCVVLGVINRGSKEKNNEAIININLAQKLANASQDVASFIEVKLKPNTNHDLAISELQRVTMKVVAPL